MTEIEARAGDNICDFCSQPNPERVFMCPDFTMDQSPGWPEYRSKGAWIACTPCGELIDKGAWDRLLLRAVDRLFPKYQAMMPRRALMDVVRHSHSLFREHYHKA